jgi:hypothetical protein
MRALVHHLSRRALIVMSSATGVIFNPFRIATMPPLNSWLVMRSAYLRLARAYRGGGGLSWARPERDHAGLFRLCTQLEVEA